MPLSSSQPHRLFADAASSGLPVPPTSIDTAPRLVELGRRAGGHVFSHLNNLADPAPSSMQSASGMSRNQSVDFVRVVAVMAVIVGHAAPYMQKHLHVGVDFNLGVLINQITRFAVPFFFVISGYFWAAQRERDDTLLQPSLRMAKRIAFLFLTWSALYLLPTNLSEVMQGGPFGLITTFLSNLRQAAGHPGTLIFEGTKVHLWFLVGLLWSLGVSALLISNKMPRTLMALAIALYLVGLCGKAYSDSPLGFHSGFNFRDGPFFGLIFFVSGYFLQRQGPRPSWPLYGMLLVIGGFTVHFAELIVLKYCWHTSTLQDFLLGTYFVDVGVAMAALANPRFLRFPRLSALGPLVVGIYVIHLAFVELLRPLDGLLREHLWWGVAYPLTVFLLSLAAVAAMSRSRLRRLLRYR